MITATPSTDVVFDMVWVDPDTSTKWLYAQGVCYSYATYCKYPIVVKHNEIQYRKMGWNSDTGSVSYRQVGGKDVVARRF